MKCPKCKNLDTKVIDSPCHRRWQGDTSSSGVGEVWSTIHDVRATRVCLLHGDEVIGGDGTVGSSQDRELDDEGTREARVPSTLQFGFFMSLSTLFA